MKKLIVSLICIFSIWFSFAVDHWSYTYEQNNIYWQEISANYRIQSAGFFNTIRNSFDPHISNNQKIERRKIYQRGINQILNSSDIYKQDIVWILTFLESRIQKRIDYLSENASNSICNNNYIFSCMRWGDYDNCIKKCSQ